MYHMTGGADLTQIGVATVLRAYYKELGHLFKDARHYPEYANLTDSEKQEIASYARVILNNNKTLNDVGHSAQKMPENRETTDAAGNVSSSGPNAFADYVMRRNTHRFRPQPNYINKGLNSMLIFKVQQLDTLQKKYTQWFPPATGHRQPIPFPDTYLDPDTITLIGEAMAYRDYVDGEDRMKLNVVAHMYDPEEALYNPNHGGYYYYNNATIINKNAAQQVINALKGAKARVQFIYDNCGYKDAADYMKFHLPAEIPNPQAYLNTTVMQPMFREDPLPGCSNSPKIPWPPAQNAPGGPPAQNAPGGPPAQNAPGGPPAQNAPRGQPHQNAPRGQPNQNAPRGQPNQNAPRGQPYQNAPRGQQPAQNAPRGQAAAPRGQPYQNAPRGPARGPRPHQT